jgi:cytoskeleton bundling-enhancing protein CbeA-like protein
LSGDDGEFICSAAGYEGVKMPSNDLQQWGLRRNISPCFGARLVQEKSRLHFLADRASFNGQFTEEQARRLDQAFPLMMKQLELMPLHR